MTALKEGKIKKPVVAWVSGTCAKLFKSEVQFGHAGAKSGGLAESAQVSALHPAHALRPAWVAADNLALSSVAGQMLSLHVREPAGQKRREDPKRRKELAGQNWRKDAP